MTVEGVTDDVAVDVVDVDVLGLRRVVENGRAVVVVSVERVVVLALVVVQAEVVTVELLVVELEVAAVDTAATVMLADPWLGPCVASPTYCPSISNVPGELGVRTTEQVPDASRLQLALALAPSEEGPLRRTNAVG